MQDTTDRAAVAATLAAEADLLVGMLVEVRAAAAPFVAHGGPLARAVERASDRLTRSCCAAAAELRGLAAADRRLEPAGARPGGAAVPVAPVSTDEVVAHGWVVDVRLAGDASDAAVGAEQRMPRRRLGASRAEDRLLAEGGTSPCEETVAARVPATTHAGHGSVPVLRLADRIERAAEAGAGAASAAAAAVRRGGLRSDAPARVADEVERLLRLAAALRAHAWLASGFVVAAPPLEAPCGASPSGPTATALLDGWWRRDAGHPRAVGHHGGGPARRDGDERPGRLHPRATSVAAGRPATEDGPLLLRCQVGDGTSFTADVDVAAGLLAGRGGPELAAVVDELDDRRLSLLVTRLVEGRTPTGTTLLRQLASRVDPASLVRVLLAAGTSLTRPLLAGTPDSLAAAAALRLLVTGPSTPAHAVLLASLVEHLDPATALALDTAAAEQRLPVDGGRPLADPASEPTAALGVDA